VEAEAAVALLVLRLLQTLLLDRGRNTNSSFLT
jgi:hypothetical protein